MTKSAYDGKTPNTNHFLEKRYRGNQIDVEWNYPGLPGFVNRCHHLLPFVNL
jgi:hypothetical protein